VAKLNIREDPLSTKKKKTVRCEFHKSNIHDRVAIAKPLITESIAQMRKWWCYDHKTWISDNWKLVIWSDELSFTLFPTSGRVYAPTLTHGGSFVLVWAGQSWYSIQLVPLLPFLAKWLQGSTWTCWACDTLHYVTIHIKFKMYFVLTEG
jgi:hypothetical protein